MRVDDGVRFLPYRRGGESWSGRIERWQVLSALAQVLSGLMAFVLIVMWILEAFFYRARSLYPIFRIEPEDVSAVRMWAINVGFYNLCFGLGVLAGLWMVNFGNADAGRGILVFALASHVLLGLVLVASNRKLWLSAVGQSGLSLAALVAVLAGG